MIGVPAASGRHLPNGPHVKVCYLAAVGAMENGDLMPPCDGALVKCHLIPKKLLKQLRLPQMDPRTWVWGCGGPMGNGGHHGMLDSSRRLRLPRSAIPDRTEEFAREHGLEWKLARDYGERA